MKKIVLPILLILAIAAINAEEKEIISYEEYCNLVKDRVIDLQLHDIVTQRAENSVFGSMSLHDVNWTTSFTGIGTQPYTDQTPYETGYVPGLQAATSFNTILPSGTMLSVGGSYGQTWTSGTTPAGMTTEDYTAVTRDGVVSIGLNQPLLYNWFGYLDRFSKKNARQKLAIARLQQEENDRTVMLYYEKLYFLWIQNSKIVNYLEQTVANATRLVEQTEEKMKSGLADNDDYQRTLQSVYTYQKQLATFKLEKQKVENELSLYFDGKSYQPDPEHFALVYGQHRKENLEVIPFMQTRNATIILATLENLEESTKRSFNQTLPQLNIYGNMDIKFHNFEQDSDSDPDPVNSYGDIDFTAGIEFKYSLGNHRARSAYRDAKLMEDETRLQYKKMEDQYRNSLFNLVSSAGNINETIELNSNTLESLKSRYNTEKTKYSQGRFELRNLVETENGITSQQMEIMKLQIQLVMLALDYKKMTEQGDTNE
jgi:outer membrane protein TolC